MKQDLIGVIAIATIVSVCSGCAITSEELRGNPPLARKMANDPHESFSNKILAVTVLDEIGDQEALQTIALGCEKNIDEALGIIKDFMETRPTAKAASSIMDHHVAAKIAMECVHLDVAEAALTRVRVPALLAKIAINAPTKVEYVRRIRQPKMHYSFEAVVSATNAVVKLPTFIEEFMQTTTKFGPSAMSSFHASLLLTPLGKR